MKDDVVAAGVILKAEERIKIPSCDIKILEIAIEILDGISWVLSLQMRLSLVGYTSKSAGSCTGADDAVSSIPM